MKVAGQGLGNFTHRYTIGGIPMTRPLFYYLVAALVFSVQAVAQQPPAEKPITIAELNRRQVVGDLGVPLGSAVEIRATVFAGSELNRKGYDSMYLLRVTHVDGKELEQPQLMEFSVPGFVRTDVVNDPFDLYKMKMGQKASSLSSEQIAELEKGYVGKTVNLSVYEVGYFSGLPRNMPRGARVWQDRAFHFSTSLTVLVDRAVEARRK